MTLATTPDQNPIDDDALSLEDCKRQVREKWRLTRQKGIDERLRADLQTIDDLLLRKLGDLDVAYQWMHDRPAVQANQLCLRRLQSWSAEHQARRFV